MPYTPINEQAPKNPEFSDTPTYYQKNSYDTKYRTDVLSAEDWLGRRFKVGDRVMYCIGAGRGQMMAIGEVKKIRTFERRYLVDRQWERDENGLARIISETWDTTLEVEVQVLTEKTSGHWDNEKRTKPAWVNPMNITALPEGFLA